VAGDLLPAGRSPVPPQLALSGRPVGAGDDLAGPLGEYLRAAMRGGASDDGMLARFGLLVWPETGGKWKNVDRIPDGPAKAAAFEVFDQLDALDPLARGAELDAEDTPPFLRFDPEALAAFTDWRCSFEAGLRSGDLYPAPRIPPRLIPQAGPGSRLGLSSGGRAPRPGGLRFNSAGAALVGLSGDTRPTLLWGGTGRRGGHGAADTGADHQLRE